MKRIEVLNMFWAMRPISVTKFSDAIQKALIANYLKLHAEVVIHDKMLEAATSKIKDEDMADENAVKVAITVARVEIQSEEIDPIDFKKIDLQQFLDEASKAKVDVTLEAIGFLKPMFNE